MAVLLVTLSIMGVMMSIAMPVWKQVSQREKEAELVFRGEQYARAIGLFQRKMGPGALPPNLNVLLEQRFLRKKFKDPVTNDDFIPLIQGVTAPPGGAALGGAAPGGAAPGAAPGGAASGAAPGAAASGGLRGAPPGGGARQVTFQSQGTGGTVTNTPGAAGGGIMGVASKSKEKSIRLYKGRNHYNEWQFVFTPPVQAPGTGTPGAPGAGRGRGGRGDQGPSGPGGFRLGGPDGGSRGRQGSPSFPPPGTFDPSGGRRGAPGR
jgi:type II secretory pathway pseudopilin PulG